MFLFLYVFFIFLFFLIFYFFVFFGKSRLKTAKIRAKKQLQSYVRAIWVKTRKRQKWFWAILGLSHVEFQTGPYITSHSKYLK